MKICKNCTEFMCSNSGVNTYSTHCKSDDKLNICILSPNREVASAFIKKLIEDKNNNNETFSSKDRIYIEYNNAIYFWERNLENLRGKRIHILYIDTAYSIEECLIKIHPLTDYALDNEIHFFKRQGHIKSK